MLAIIKFILRQIVFFILLFILSIIFFFLSDFILPLSSRIEALSFLYPMQCVSCPNCGACLITNTHSLYRLGISLLIAFPLVTLLCKKWFKNRIVYMIVDFIILVILVLISNNIYL